MQSAFFVGLLWMISVSVHASLDSDWHLWKSQHSKAYKDGDEEGAKKSVWHENYRKIAQHNNANHSYSLALNEFADLVRYCKSMIVTLALANDKIIC